LVKGLVSWSKAGSPFIKFIKYIYIQKAVIEAIQRAVREAIQKTVKGAIMVVFMVFNKEILTRQL